MYRILMLGGTGAIGTSIIDVLRNNNKYEITVTSRQNRISEYSNVLYLQGNANELEFLNTIPDDSYDVLVDFMNYRNENLERNIHKLIKIAKQYIFLSSSRVYDNSQRIIDENCSLFWDTTDDVDFRNSGTYAVKKAYQERFVKEIGKNKVTIVRPYKTYMANRLQLGEYEIKNWLRRIVNNRPIVINEDILDKDTTLTSGTDVAKGIISLFGNLQTYGETYQIATSEYMTWGDVLNIYVKVLKEKGFNPVIYLAKNTEPIDKLFECGYHMPYDIKLGRRFNSAKIDKIKHICYKPMKEGLEEALLKNLKETDYSNFENTEYDEVVDDFIANMKCRLKR